MKLYIVRHGRSVDAAYGIPDALRHLTAKGRERFRDTVQAARREGMSVDAIFCSPLVRAVQTADLLAEGLRFGGEVVAATELATGLFREDLAGFLEQQGSPSSVALVGHNPYLSRLATELMGSEGIISMKKGAIAAFELSSDLVRKGATLLWMLADGRKENPFG
ncbi:MAG TPA: histidine phosphatase family protein [Candidatus Deferrimicrobiaceae bacterium]|jgi:phosphohistidine phosphatase